MLAAAIEARKKFQTGLIEGCAIARPLSPADTNILCFSIAEEEESLSAANARTKAAFDGFRMDREFSLSRTVLSTDSYEALIDAHVASYRGKRDSNELVLLRCVFMNPFWSNPAISDHLIPRFVETLNRFVA